MQSQHLCNERPSSELKENSLKSLNNSCVLTCTEQNTHLEALSEEKINYLVKKAQENLEASAISKGAIHQKNIQNSVFKSAEYHIHPTYILKTGNTSYLNPEVIEKSYRIIDDNIDRSIEYEKPLSRKEKQNKKEETAGEKWFHMPKTELTESLKTELQILKMRNILDPKRHYRKDNRKELPKYFQIGTMIDDVLNTPLEELSKKRTHTILDEILEDQDKRQYFKKKYNDIQKAKMSGRKAFYKKLKEKRKPFRS
ncbi:hypothetical protein PORY_002527 [Pneumocystis oryctolagi]|uniref:Uncharacterized protein n=1 Tax=Pneumocystis oryctolagi TaxID=42067 RepID=A0ACB7CB14_9ASCO|nr:hypothetical protein PORY_002527 [Pneumocystis oryctolagi]